MREGKVLFEKTSRIKVLVVGRMIGWKGFDIAIDAFKIASQRIDNVDLYFTYLHYSYDKEKKSFINISYEGYAFKKLRKQDIFNIE